MFIHNLSVGTIHSPASIIDCLWKNRSTCEQNTGQKPMLLYAVASPHPAHGDSSKDGSGRSLDSPESQCSIGFQPVFCSRHRTAFSKLPPRICGGLRSRAGTRGKPRFGRSFTLPGASPYLRRAPCSTAIPGILGIGHRATTCPNSFSIPYNEGWMRSSSGSNTTLSCSLGSVRAMTAMQFSVSLRL